MLSDIVDIASNLYIWLKDTDAGNVTAVLISSIIGGFVLYNLD
jgi:hypothetical protein